MSSRFAASLFCAGTLVAGCAGLPPALTTAVVAFGQQLIGTASENFSPEYAESVNQLLLTVAELASGAPFTQVASNDTYGGYNNNPYGAQTTPGYDTAGSPDYGTAAPQYPASYPAPAVTYPGSSEGPSYPTQTPGTYSGSVSYPTPAAVTDVAFAPTLDAALLAQAVTASGEVSLRLVQNGETLRDGGANPAAGDKIKLSFQANCACFLYVIGIDATGWVTQMHPEAGQFSVPLVANQSYLLPEGTEWWGLDSYKGVEQIYFILSRTQRFDLEQALQVMPTSRQSPGSNYQSVSEPALLATRGLVKVQAAAPTSVDTSYGQPQNLMINSFTTQMQTGDLVITLWFLHE